MSLLRLYSALVLALCLAAPAAAIQPGPRGAGLVADDDNKHKKKEFTSPLNLFIQERASKQLPGPGQHFRFGALQPWDQILDEQLLSHPKRKLLLLVRHGQAISNWLSDTLGPDEWFKVEETCIYKGDDDVSWGLFDADLTGLGAKQASSLNSILNGGGGFKQMTRGLPVRAVVSPLSRCLETANLVLANLTLNATSVDEYARETLGEDTCDARRSVSNPPGRKDPDAANPCPFKHGLASKFPNYKFPVLGWRKDGFGLLSDQDQLWKPDTREHQHKQVKRAKLFLETVFRHAPERIVVVITHSGFTRSVLLAAGREPYRPVNAELVPLIVEWDPKLAPLAEARGAAQ